MVTETIAAAATLAGVGGAFLFGFKKWLSDLERRIEDRAQRREDALRAEMGEIKAAVRDMCVQHADDRKADERRREDDRKADERRREDDRKADEKRREDDLVWKAEIMGEITRLTDAVSNLCRMREEDRQSQRDEIKALCARLDALERKVDALGARVGDIDRRLAVLESQFRALGEAVLPHALPAGAPGEARGEGGARRARAPGSPPGSAPTRQGGTAMGGPGRRGSSAPGRGMRSGAA